MRFHEALAALPMADQESLLNQLTLGCGRLAYAARLARADRPCGHILDLLAIAHAALMEAERVLLRREPAVGAPPSATGAAEAGLRALSWRDFLATCRPDDATGIAAELAVMVGQARALGEAILADEPIAAIQGQVTATREGLHDLHQWLSSAIEL